MAKVVGALVVDTEACKGFEVCMPDYLEKVISMSKEVNRRRYHYAYMRNGDKLPVTFSLLPLWVISNKKVPNFLETSCGPDETRTFPENTLYHRPAKGSFFWLKVRL